MMHNTTKKRVRLQQIKWCELQQKKPHTYSKEDDVLVAKKMTCLQQRRQCTSKKCIATKTTMCNKDDAHCIEKKMKWEQLKERERIEENTRKIREKQRKNMIYHRIITIMHFGQWGWMFVAMRMSSVPPHQV